MLHLPGIEIRKKKSLFELRRWDVTKDVDLLDVGEGRFQEAKNVLHKTHMLYFVWFNSSDTMTMLGPSAGSVSPLPALIHACAVKSVAWP